MKYLITGASSGIGKQCTEQLLSQGNACVIVVQNKDHFMDIVSMYPQLVKVVSADISSINNIKEIFDKVVDWYPFDGLVHCTGIVPLKRTGENIVDADRKTYITNVFSFIELMRLFAGNGVCKDGASIIIMTVIAQISSEGQSVYLGTQAALDAIARCMARELVGRNIRINTVISRTVEIEVSQQLKKEQFYLNGELKFYSNLDNVPIEEVCAIIKYLLSDKSAHITGASIKLDARCSI